MQKLILPINKMRFTAGYKNKNYRTQFGFNHYGVDATSESRQDFRVWGSGNGKVVATGWDDVAGNCVIIKYENCVLTDGRVKDLVIRYFHFATVNVKLNQRITKDTLIGHYGNTGYSTGAHLHIEIDTDTKYYAYSPTVSKSGRIILKGIDSTIDPTTCLYIKTSSPDNQKVLSAGYDTVAPSDLTYQFYN